MAKAGLLCFFAYVVAGVAAVLVAVALGDRHPIWVAAAADATATIVVFAFSRTFDNSSFYDPYWSVAPLALVPYWWWQGGSSTDVRALLVAALVGWWAVRLTYNWARRWNGLEDEDWRYVDLRRKHGRRYWAVSFVGIHFFPTVLVFGGLLPAYWALTTACPLTFLDAVAAGITIFAILIETIADRQLHEFVSEAPAPGSILATGLWRYSRHPNYFGEVTFWWGLALFGLASSPSRLWLICGAVAITLLFTLVSIPMLEERMRARRPKYVEHARRTSALVPWPPKGT